MLKKILMLLMLLSLLAAPLMTTAQPLPPPTGIHDALVDLSERLGTTFALICDDPANGSTCRMNDLRLNWSWSENIYPDNRIGCGTIVNYAGIATKGYNYELTFQGTLYDYRQNVVTGELFLCTTAGAVAVEVNRARSACPITPRLAVGLVGRVRSSSTPNNLRAAADQDAALVGQIPAGGIFTVLAGPQCLENFVWWQVNYSGLVGWTAEGGSSGEYFLEPADEGVSAAPSELVVTNLAPITADNAASLRSVWSMTLPSFPYDLSYSAENRWMAVVDVNGLAIYEARGGEVPLMIARNSNTVYDRVAFSRGQLAAAQNFVNADGQRLSQIWTWITRPIVATGVAQDFPLNEVVYITLPTPIEGTVSKLEYNNAGNLLAFSTLDALTVYDVNTGQVKLTIESAPRLENFALSPVQNFMAVGKGSNVLEVWDIDSGQLRGSLPLSPDVTTLGLGNALAFSPNGAQLAYVSGVNTVTIVDTLTLSTQRTLIVPNENTMVIQNILFSDDGNLLIVSGNVPQLESFDYLFDLRTGTPIPRQIGGDGSQAIFGRDGTLHWLQPNPPAGTRWLIYGVG